MPDFIFNGQAHGDVADRLMANGFDPGALRPFLGKDGHSYVTVNRGGKPSVLRTNTAATLRHEEWLHIDQAIVKAARQRLKVVADLRSRGLEYVIPNGMGSTSLLTEKMSDPGEAMVSMDGLRESPNDRPQYDSANLPLPIVHHDWSMSARQLTTGRQAGTPIDTSMGEAVARRVSEEVEKLTLGVSTVADQFTYASGTLYGISDFPQNGTQTLTAPTASGWTPATTLQEVLEMKQTAFTARHYGPFALYVSTAWDQYLERDYSSNYSGETLRTRLQKVDGIAIVQDVDFLSGYVMALVQLTSDVIRMVVGMEIVTVQWDSNGGLKKNFKVMCIMVPQIRSDYNGRCGIVYGSTS